MCVECNLLSHTALCRDKLFKVALKVSSVGRKVMICGDTLPDSRGILRCRRGVMRVERGFNEGDSGG